MATYHMFSNGYYLGPIEKDDGLTSFLAAPASDVTEFEEFDNPVTPVPSNDWVEYIVKSMKLSDGGDALIAVHGEMPDSLVIEDFLMH